MEAPSQSVQGIESALQVIGKKYGDAYKIICTAMYNLVNASHQPNATAALTRSINSAASFTGSIDIDNPSSFPADLLLLIETYKIIGQVIEQVVPITMAGGNINCMIGRVEEVKRKLQ